MTIHLAYPKVNYVEIGFNDSGSLIRLILCNLFALEY